jgi:hypothetical protein
MERPSETERVPRQWLRKWLPCQNIVNSLTCVSLGLLESLILGGLIVDGKYEAGLLVGEVVGLNVTQLDISSE